MKPVIRVENLSKSYKISHKTKAPYGTLKDDFTNLFKKPLGRGGEEEKETFWALKDISFEVRQGEAFGIIGKNGSGKSTLLKILSKIVEPTRGTAILHGKTASMLEVGTGFHPELTGRENIFFNGSMIGMSRQEIRNKFDDIVDFSGVEKFLDTPVKFYSSGMYVRLAFAVAAHLEPDILIIDEVLAVGDAQFQKKSLDKMMSIAKSGKTILFVSHSMTAVEELCDTALLLHKGKVKAIGPSGEVADRYMTENLPEKLEISTIERDEKVKKTKKEEAEIQIEKREDREGSGRVKFIKLEVHNSIKENRQLRFDFVLQNNTRRNFDNIKLSIDLFDDAGNYVSNLLNYNVGEKINLLAGKNKLSIVFDKMNLAPGIYYLNCFSAKDYDHTEVFDWVQNASLFKVPTYDYYHINKNPKIATNYPIFLDYHYEIES